MWISIWIDQTFDIFLTGLETKQRKPNIWFLVSSFIQQQKNVCPKTGREKFTSDQNKSFELTGISVAVGVQ